MKSRLNNLIVKYEAEETRLKAFGAPTPAVAIDLKVVSEMLKALRSLRS